MRDHLAWPVPLLVLRWPRHRDLPGGCEVTRLLLPAHETTSAHLAGAFPWLSGGGSAVGPYLGDHMGTGEGWSFSPHSAYAAGDTTGPNMMIAGMVGRAKSSLVKVLVAYAVGMLGGHAVVLDPKGEYAQLADYLGRPSVRLRAGSGVRLNLLDGDRDSLPVVLAGIARSALGHALDPVEDAGVAVALTTAASLPGLLHLGTVADALLFPESEQADALGFQGARALDQLRDATRQVALALRHLVTTALPGVVDGPTSPELLDGRLLVLDLSGVGDDRAVRVCMAAAMRWSAATTSSGNGLLVADEAWRVLADPGAAEAAQAAWKLARARGVAGVLVLHRLSDLDAVGPAGSRERAIAHGLVADSETRVMFGQDESEAAALAGVVGLSDREVKKVTGLPRGCALWRAGRRTSSPVRHKVPNVLIPLVDTDGAMRGTA